MSSLTVACVMLVCERFDMVTRALKSFRAQTYENKHLLIYDTSAAHVEDLADMVGFDGDDEDVTLVESKASDHHGKPKTIGHLRNRANHNATADIIAHWDSDDYSSPQRLTEQVALLQASGADAVGYNEALFFDSTRGGWIFDEANASKPGNSWPEDVHRREGEAWLYTSPKSDVALGGTLAYWRRTWERKRFADVRHGEDTLWQTGMRVKAVSGLGTKCGECHSESCDHPGIRISGDPRFIAAIHGSNTSSVITPTVRDWKRMPGRDEECGRLMQL